ncbi:MAG: radical SAM protein, partial [Myxococcota bacterium]|nr:radical SAM protein [Myxococcota bacterium]
GDLMAGRLMVRLTTQCNSGCAHCTIADIAHLPERSAEEVWAEIQAGRQRGCDELVFMRGEATLRRELLKLVRRSRDIGYGHIQIQTNARMLAYPEYVDKLTGAGVTFWEVSFFGHNAGLHDLIDDTEGAFDQALAGLQNLVAAGCPLMVTVPVIRRNHTALPDIVRFLHGQGVSRVQLNFSRPVKVGPQWQTEVLVSLDECSGFIREALREARALGITGETEAVPLCHLDPEDAFGADMVEDFSRHQVVDVHRVESDLTDHRETMRPRAEPCTTCSVADRCPRTWSAYQELYGTWELRPLSAP